MSCPLWHRFKWDIDARKEQHRQKALTQQELAVSNEGGSLLGKINVEVITSQDEGEKEDMMDDALDPALKRYYNSLEMGGQDAGIVIEDGSSEEDSDDEEFTTV
jgi:hypothetical protein